ncbi:HMA2 domain-containing protein [Serpentinicella alkaliphila]|uniref:Uncharacterized protein n=1 Tax=Serpentinicella alkaliphila TaxID=1734049 RepID=A0A4R2SXR9_9FIRM|nr:hypothetical protein [Serpentinicella alkaliphila]QUH25856.1 hypothetical protein HZR23_08980 [Serpentinicella alkaliphila]TCP95297.1 hypothetical protein EDD79_10613 [Serpentinicella alkaliphila]
MINCAIDKIEVISSIPGRIRLNTNKLCNQNIFENSILIIFQKVKGIKNVIYNKHTGNTLIYYEEEFLTEDEVIKHLMKSSKEEFTNNIRNFETNKLLKEILPAFNPLNLIKRKYSEQMYSNEYNLSKSLLRLGLTAGIIGLAINTVPVSLLSLSILSYPGIFFAITSIGYSYVSALAKGLNIYVDNLKTIKLLARTNKVLIEDKVLLDEINSSLDFSNTTSQEDYSFIKIKYRVNFNGKDFIKDFRKYGVLKFGILTKQKNHEVEILSDYLTINNIYEESNNVIHTIGKSKENITAIGYINTLGNFKKLNQNISINILNKENSQNSSTNISILEEDLNQIPKLFRLSQIGEELINRSHTIALTINSIALLMIPFIQLHPITALMIYGLNLLIQIYLLQNYTDNYKGVLFNDL